MAEPVALQVQNPNFMNSLGAVLNVANQSVALKRAQGMLAPSIAQAQSQASSAQTAASLAQQTLASRVAEQQAETSTAQTGAKAAQFKLSSDQSKLMQQFANGFVNDPSVKSGDSDGILRGLSDAMSMGENAGIPRPVIMRQMSPLIQAATTNPAGFRQMLASRIVSSLGPQSQVGAIQPSGPAFNTGQQTGQINTNPLAGPSGPVPGTVQQQQLPPATPTFNPNTNTPGYLGPQGAPQAAPQPVVPNAAPQAPQGAGFVPSGPPLGTSQYLNTLAGNTENDLQQVTQNAALASRNIGVFQTANEFANDATMSVGATQRAFTSGIFGLAGIKSAERAKTSSDVLTKNLSMVLGGDTDMARSLAQMSNPHQTMTREAYKITSEEVIAQLQMVQKEAAYLQKNSSNPIQYQQAKAQFAQINNPRLIQFYNRMQDNDKTGAQRILSGMSKDQKAQFIAQGDMAMKMGILGGPE